MVVVKYSGLSPNTPFGSKVYLAFQGVMYVQYYCNKPERDYPFSLTTLKKVLENNSSKLMYVRNDIITRDLEKVVGSLCVKKNNFQVGNFFINYNMHADLLDWLPVEDQHRPLANVDIDIQKIITDFIKICDEEIGVEFCPMEDIAIQEDKNTLTSLTKHKISDDQKEIRKKGKNTFIS
jgi:hypothetical protein